MPFRAQVISLLALPVAEGEQGPKLMWPVRELRVYVERSKSFRKTEQLPVTKQRLSRWIVDVIALVYASVGSQCPIDVRAHSTRGMASSWVWSSGISIGEICVAAGWFSLSTFARFYSLDVLALQVRILSA